MSRYAFEEGDAPERAGILVVEDHEWGGFKLAFSGDDGHEDRAVVEQMRQEYARGIALSMLEAEPMLAGTDLGPDGLTIDIDHFGAIVMASSFRKSLGEAPNYVEIRLRSTAAPPLWMLVTVQRLAGKSPHELRREAELRCEALERDITSLTEQLADAKREIAGLPLAVAANELAAEVSRTEGERLRRELADVQEARREWRSWAINQLDVVEREALFGAPDDEIRAYMRRPPPPRDTCSRCATTAISMQRVNGKPMCPFCIARGGR